MSNPAFTCMWSFKTRSKSNRSSNGSTKSTCDPHLIKENLSFWANISYCEFVKGSGGILLSLLLNLFGFRKFLGNQSTGEDIQKGMIYSIINKDSVSTLQIENIKKTPKLIDSKPNR